MAQKLADALKSEAPNDTGTLAEALSEMSPVRKTAEGRSIGLGPLSRLGDPSQATPNTLRSFFDDHPQFKPSRWRWMSRAAKDLLQESREQGFYGGPAYAAGAPARYYYVHEGGEAAWETSAAKADIMPTRFTFYEIQYWRESVVPEEIGRLLGA